MVADAHQIVSRRRECEHPAELFQPPMPQLTQQPHGFHPAKHMFNSLAFSLAHTVAVVTSGALINGLTGSTPQPKCAHSNLFTGPGQPEEAGSAPGITPEGRFTPHVLKLKHYFVYHIRPSKAVSDAATPELVEQLARQ